MSKTLTVPFTAEFGVVVNVTLESSDPSSLLPAMREYGRIGWTAIKLQKKGHKFPLENEEDFDWDLLGATPATLKNPDGTEERGVWWQRQFFKRRELEENKKFKMPKGVTYSRGAKATDSAEITSGAEGEIGYVTLAIFQEGKRNERWAKSQANGSRSARDSSSTQQPHTLPAGSRGDLCTQLSKLGTVSEITAPYGVKSFQDMSTEQLQEALERRKAGVGRELELEMI